VLHKCVCVHFNYFLIFFHDNEFSVLPLHCFYCASDVIRRMTYAGFAVVFGANEILTEIRSG
jgi:hypothetical protein